MGCNATASFVDGNLFVAAEKNNVPMAKHFMQNIKQVNEVGETALIVAVRHESLDVAKLLVKHEAGMKDRNGWTALMWAEEKQNKDLLMIHLPAEAGI